MFYCCNDSMIIRLQNYCFFITYTNFGNKKCYHFMQKCYQKSSFSKSIKFKNTKKRDPEGSLAIWPGKPCRTGQGWLG